jgi:hypothetical protein
VFKNELPWDIQSAEKRVLKAKIVWDPSLIPTNFDLEAYIKKAESLSGSGLG